MRPKKDFGVEHLLPQFLIYCPDTGDLTWNERPRVGFKTDRAFKIWNKRFAGKKAFTALTSGGYLHGNFCGAKLKAHRVAWFLTYGKWPAHLIDHIDGNPSNNRIDNLRDCSDAENSKNRGRASNNRSGVTGVSWVGKIQSWHAYIYVSRSTREHLGYFKSIEDAKQARAEAVARHGYSARHGA